MSLKRRILSLFIVFTILLAIVTSSVLLFTKSMVNKQVSDRTKIMSEKANQEISVQLNSLSQDIANEVIVLESAYDQSMLNAAYVVQQLDQKHNVTNDELNSIKTKLKMSQLYITDEKGNFIKSTEPKAIGGNLFEIWNGYKMLITKEAEVLPSTLKIAVESGNILKFTAIPRFNGKGIIETAMDANDFEKIFSSYMKEKEGIQLVNLIDTDKTVLAESMKKGISSKWEKGSKMDNSQIADVISSHKANIKVTEEKANIYYPVMQGENLRYILYLQVDSKPYFANINETKKSFSYVSSHLSKSIKVVILLTVLISLLALVLIFLVVSRRMEPLKQLTITADNLSRGDLTVHLEKSKSKDEIGQLTNAFIKMIEHLKTLIQGSSLAATTVEESTTNLQEMLAQTQQSIDQVSNAINEIAAGTTEQAYQTTETVNKSGELRNSATHLKNNANEMLLMTKEMQQINTDGKSVIDDLTEQQLKSQESVENIMKIVQQLGNQISNIQAFTTVISSISDQTNLLALNASIEAARAGDAGKGFAVVAQEVRKLAEESQKSSLEIHNVIEQVMRDTNSSIQVVEVLQEHFSNQYNSVVSTKTVFNRIDDSINGTVHRILDVHTLIQNFDGVIDEVLTSISEISAVTQQTAASSEEVSASVEQQAASIHEINQRMVDLAVIAEELKAKINTFKL